MFFDSHTHLNDEHIYPERDRIIKEAIEAGALGFLVIGWDYESSLKAVSIAHEYSNVYAAVGFHPENLEVISDDMLSKIKKIAVDPKVKAIGEIGLDYHWYKDEKDHINQKEWFIKQIAIANELSLPCSIHARDAALDTYEILKANPIKNGAALHCYSSSPEMMERFLALSPLYYFGFDGPITFKNADMPKKNVVAVPLDKFLFETDAPYLAPSPFRGKTNEPKYIPYIIKEFAVLKNMDVLDIEKRALENTKKLFHVEL